MQRLRAADEAHRGHAEAECVHRLRRGGDRLGMVGEAEIIVGAEIERLALAGVQATRIRPPCGPVSRSRLKRPAASISARVARIWFRNASDMAPRAVAGRAASSARATLKSAIGRRCRTSSRTPVERGNDSAAGNCSDSSAGFRQPSRPRSPLRWRSDRVLQL